ncbi:MAG: MFS transporter, partial [Pseudomonadota bacterium]
MRLGGRVAAAIEILDDMAARHRPVSEALRDWGVSHRFAGAADRSAIGNLIYDVLRRRSSLAWVMGSETHRALVLGALGHMWSMDSAAVTVAFDGDRHAPEAPTPAEAAAMDRQDAGDDGSPWIMADVPEWLWASFEDGFEDDAIAEGQALATRPPL